MAAPEKFALPEPVDFANFAALREQAMTRIDAARGEVEISFHGLAHSGSAGVALMMGLFRHAHRQGKALSFVEVPPDLRNIIELAELDDVLPLELGGEGAAGAAPAAGSEG